MNPENKQLGELYKKLKVEKSAGQLQKDWVEKEVWSWRQLGWIKQRVERITLPENCPLPISVKMIQGSNQGAGEGWIKKEAKVLEADEHLEEIEWVERYDQQVRKSYQERERKWEEITKKLMDNYQRKEEELTNLKKEWELIQGKLQEAINEQETKKKREKELRNLRRRLESREKIEIEQLKGQVAGKEELEKELTKFWQLLEDLDNERRILILEYELLSEEWEQEKKQELLNQMNYSREKVENLRRKEELKAWDEWFSKEQQKKAFHSWKRLVKSLKEQRKIRELEAEIKKLEQLRKINLFGKAIKWTTRRTLPTAWATSIEVGIDAYEIRGETNNWAYELSWVLMGILLMMGMRKITKRWEKRWDKLIKKESKKSKFDS